MENQVTDDELVEIAIDEGFGTEMGPDDGYPNNVLWFDSNPLPMLRRVVELTAAKQNT